VTLSPNSLNVVAYIFSAPAILLTIILLRTQLQLAQDLPVFVEIIARFFLYTTDLEKV